MDTFRLNLSMIVFLMAFTSTIPQIWHTIKSGSTGDFNGWNLFLNLVVNILLMLHGVYSSDIGITALGGWFVIYWLILLRYKIKGNTGILTREN